MKYKPDFLIVPYALIEDKKIKPLDERVYSIVYYFANMRGEKCIASNEAIASLCKSSGKSVQNSLLNLEKHGYVQRLFSDSEKKNRSEIIPLLGMRYHPQVTQVPPTDGTGVPSTDDHIINNNINKIYNKHIEHFKKYWEHNTRALMNKTQYESLNSLQESLGETRLLELIGYIGRIHTEKPEFAPKIYNPTQLVEKYNQLIDFAKREGWEKDYQKPKSVYRNL